jgi:hypothetical protein
VTNSVEEKDEREKESVRKSRIGVSQRRRKWGRMRTEREEWRVLRKP